MSFTFHVTITNSFKNAYYYYTNTKITVSQLQITDPNSVA